MIEQGKAYDVESESVPIGAIIIATINNLEAFQGNDPHSLEILFENSGHLAEDLFVQVIINAEMAKGTNVGIIHHPSTDVVFNAEEE